MARLEWKRVDAAVLNELQQDGLAHHMVGLVDRNGKDVGLDTQTTFLKCLVCM